METLYEILKKACNEIDVTYKEYAPKAYRYCIKCDKWSKYNIYFPITGFGETLLDSIYDAYANYKHHKSHIEERISWETGREEKIKQYKENYTPKYKEERLKDYSPSGKLYRKESVPDTDSWRNRNFYYKDEIRLVKPGYIKENYVVDEHGIICYMIYHKPKYKGEHYYEYQRYRDKNWNIFPYNRTKNKKEFYKEIKDTL